MAYFLKKTNNKKGLYIQIYESFYDPKRGHTAHRSYKAIGYVHELQSQGIEDPISFYKEEVNKLNVEKKAIKLDEKAKQISNETPEKILGYFPIKNINTKLGIEPFLDILQTTKDFQFSIYQLLSALIYSRIVKPCSKSKTFEQVIPKLFDNYDFSLSQIYSGLDFIGNNYERIIEIYNHQINKFYPLNTKQTYFDCTNFFFEIDKEDDFRKKGPSKENRKSPIVGMGLLLDSNQIPMGMKLYPGNESEKPILRSSISDLKAKNNISGRTVQVADKGLNCSENIIEALKNGDGYIFSKSVKQLPEVEQTWVLLENDYKEVIDKDNKLLYKIKECKDEFIYKTKNKDGKTINSKISEKCVVTYNPTLAKKQIYEIDRLIEKAKALRTSQAKKSEYGECAKYVNFISTNKEGEETDEKVKVQLNEEMIEKSKKLAGYNLIVTSEVKMNCNEIYKAYHNLWRIEESFKIMKSQLDARPVYLQKENTIKGHFLICYLAVVLTRIFQIKIMKDSFSSEETFDFFKEFKAVQKSSKEYINLTSNSNFISEFAAFTKLPLTSYYLRENDILKMISYKI